MFILQDAEGRTIQVLAAAYDQMWALLREDEIRKYPYWSQVDFFYSAQFESNEMDALIADLERLKSYEELSLVRQEWRQRLEAEIVALEAERARVYSSTMWSPPPNQKFDALRDQVRMAEREPQMWPEHLRGEIITPFVNSIIALARACRQSGGRLIFEPHHIKG